MPVTDVLGVLDLGQMSVANLNFRYLSVSVIDDIMVYHTRIFGPLPSNQSYQSFMVYVYSIPVEYWGISTGLLRARGCIDSDVSSGICEILCI